MRAGDSGAAGDAGEAAEPGRPAGSGGPAVRPGGPGGPNGRPAGSGGPAGRDGLDGVVRGPGDRPGSGPGPGSAFGSGTGDGSGSGAVAGAGFGPVAGSGGGAGRGGPGMRPLADDEPVTIGPYRLLGRLGAGGMGRVYLGRSAGGRTVAVKIVHPHFALDEEFRARFRREVEAARRVGGAWTAPVLDADPDAPVPWVATAYAAGPSLASAVTGTGPLPEHTVRALAAGLAEALTAVHALGLVHRDVKPSNVLLTLDGPLLIDFGIARATDGTASLTATGASVGSPGYMAPEQILGKSVTGAADVFSLGAVLTYAATGRSPFPGNSSAALLYKVVHEEPELGALGGELRAVAEACLAKDPSARPAPAEVSRRLAPEGAARSIAGGWLPGPLVEQVSRSAVQLLNLDTAETVHSGPVAFDGPSVEGTGVGPSPIPAPAPIPGAVPTPGPGAGAGAVPGEGLRRDAGAVTGEFGPAPVMGPAPSTPARRLPPASGFPAVPTSGSGSPTEPASASGFPVVSGSGPGFPDSTPASGFPAPPTAASASSVESASAPGLPVASPSGSGYPAPTPASGFPAPPALASGSPAESTPAPGLPVASTPVPGFPAPAAPASGSPSPSGPAPGFPAPPAPASGFPVPPAHVPGFPAPPAHAPAPPGTPTVVPAPRDGDGARPGKLSVSVAASASPPDTGGGRRISCTVALAVAGVLAVATVGAGALLRPWSGGHTSEAGGAPNPAGSSATPGATPPGDSAPRPGGTPTDPPQGGSVGGGTKGPGAIPARYLGTWEGQATALDGGRHLGTYRLTVHQAAVGAELGRLRRTDERGRVCTDVLTLRQATASRLTATSAGHDGCDSATHVVELTPTYGDLTYTSDSETQGNPVAVLTKAG